MMPSEFVQTEDWMFDDILRCSKDITTYEVDIPVIQSNKIAQEGTPAVSYIEYRILLTLLAVIEREKDFTGWYKFYIPALAKLSNVDMRSMRKTLEGITVSLKDKQIFITSENSEEIFCVNWLSSLYSSFKTGFVCVRLNPSLAEWSVNLKEHYMRERLSALVCYVRYAASILHGFFCSKFNYSTSRMNAVEMERYVKEITIPIDSLKFILSNERQISRYDKTSNFLIKVVVPALLEINAKNYYHVYAPPETEPVMCQIDKPLFRINKNGKTITKITFFVGAGENNTRLAEQRIIDAKETEKQKEKTSQLKEAKKKGLNIDESSDRELIDAILKAIPKGQLQNFLEKTAATVS